MEKKTLSERASEIMLGNGQTHFDITELQKIKREMSVLYSQFSEMSGTYEYNYNLIREKQYITLSKSLEKISENNKNKQSKEKAENDFGEYRIYKAKAIGMKAMISAIESFCINYHTNMKHQDQTIKYDIEEYDLEDDEKIL